MYFDNNGVSTPENPCCSAIKPCSTQKANPSAVCDVCLRAHGIEPMLTVGSQSLFKSTALVSRHGEIALRCEEGSRTRAYLDSRGIPTIGVGHTMNAPFKAPFTMHSVWTEDHIDAVFMNDLSPFVQAANADLHVPINQCQFDALVSLEFNIGMAGLRKSHLVDVINLHGANAVTEHDFLAWAHPSELKGRRMREWAMYSQGIYRAA